jgi:hypothetical protein
MDSLVMEIRMMELRRRYYRRFSRDTSIRPDRRQAYREWAVYYEGVVEGLRRVLGSSYERLQKEVVA